MAGRTHAAEPHGERRGRGACVTALASRSARRRQPSGLVLGRSGALCVALAVRVVSCRSHAPERLRRGLELTMRRIQACVLQRPDLNRQALIVSWLRLRPARDALGRVDALRGTLAGFGSERPFSGCDDRASHSSPPLRLFTSANLDCTLPLLPSALQCGHEQGGYPLERSGTVNGHRDTQVGGRGFSRLVAIRIPG